MSQQSGSWEGKPVRAFIVRIAAFLLPLVFAVFVAWQLSRALPQARTWPGVILMWLIVMAAATLALRFADRVAKRLMPLAVLMKLSLVFPDRAPSRFGVSMKSGNAHSLEELIDRAEAAGRQDDLTEAAETILALAAALNAHDPRTRGHGDRVRAYADMLGEEMGLDPDGRNKLKWAAMLHDIGKLRVPAEIINKPGGLNDDEWQTMRKHPNWGMELAAPLLPWLGEYAAAIGQHHERFDGGGYPNGLAGEEIGLAARITSVADTYDVMTSVRSYKEARPANEAREELARCAGSQFDPVVVRAFLNISLGRQRWVAGPLSWIGSSVPMFQSALQGLTTAASHAATVVQTATAASAIGATAVVAPSLVTVERPPEPPAALPAIVVEANDDIAAISEDGSGDIVVLANDEVEDATITILDGPDHGTAVVNDDGTLSYEPDPNYAGVDAITYRVCAASGVCDTAVLSINVSPVNDPPGLEPVDAGLDEDGTTEIDIIGRVTDIDGDPASATVTLVGLAEAGLVLANGDGTFRYTPPPDFFGTDTFTVEICDEGGACALFTVPVSVSPVNDPPIVAVGPIDATEDTPAFIPVDVVDPDGEVVGLAIVDPPGDGVAVVELDGSITYSPGSDFSGADSFTLQACDPSGSCVEETIVVNVAPVNDAPVVPGPGPLVTVEESAISFDPLAGATDADGDVLFVESFDATSANGGTIVEGSLVYTPPVDFTGVDSFSYTVSDGTDSVSVAVSVTVTPVNDDPVGSVPPVAATEDTPSLIDVLGWFSDPDGDVLAIVSFESVTGAGGTVIDNGDGTLTYGPPPDFFGSDAFSFTVGDGTTTIAGSVSLTVAPVPEAPIAVDDVVAASGVGAEIWDLVFNDGDLDGDLDPASLVILTPPGVGSVSSNGDGTVTYVPVIGSTGTTTFTYEICDLGGLCSAAATVTVNLNGPSAADDTYDVAEDSSSGPFPVTANDVDADLNLDPSTVAIVGSPLHGSATVGGSGLVTYTPDPDWDQSDVFTYEVCDTEGACDTATVTITIIPVNDPPEAVADGPSVAEDSASGVTFSVLFNDTDPDTGASLTVASFDDSTIAAGVLTDLGAGNFKYVPGPNFVGVESFTYDVTDGLATDTGTVTITVTGVPDAPEAQDDAYVTDQDVAIFEAAPGVLGNDSDYDGDPLTAVPGTGPSDGVLALNPDGSFTYTPNPGFTGTDTFTYTAFDGTLSSPPATVAITVDSGVTGLAWFFGDSGSGPDDFDFVPVPPTPGIPDPDGDLNPGLTVVASTGSESEVDPAKFHNWILDPGATGVQFNGPVVLTLWSTVADYELGKAVDLTVRLYDCDAVTLGSCTPALLVYDVHTNNWNGGVADFGSREVTLGSLTHSLLPGRVLKLRLQFGHEDVWVDMNATHPTELSLTLANLPPNAVDDAYPLVPPMLEDGPLVNFDVLANDVDPDLDPSSLALEPAPVPVGTVGLKGDNTFDYTPAGDFVGIDTFAYRVCDTAPACSTATVTVTITPVNDAPVFTKGADQVVLEDSGQTNVAAWATGIDEGGGADEDPQAVSFVVSGSPGDLAMFDTLEVRADGELRVQPADDAFGVANLSVAAVDDGGTANGGVDTSAGQAFTITITNVNDEPDFVDGPDVDVDEDSGPHTIAGWATGITAGTATEEPPVQALTFTTVGNDNPGLFASGPDVDPATGDLSFSLNAEAYGQANIQLKLTDDGGTANGGDDESPTRPFAIDVAEVNDAPSFIKGSDVTVPMDSGAHSLVGWATSISSGPANESSQSVAFNTTGNSNPALFSAQPLVASTGTLVFTVAPGQSGTATITIEAQDNGGTANGGADTSPSQSFTITVGSPSVVISEFRPRGPGGADDEFVEVFNAGSTAEDLSGWKLHITSGLDFDFYTFPSVSLAPGQHYLVMHPFSPLAGLADDTWVGLSYGTGFGDVQLLTGSGAQVDALHYGTGPTVGEGAPLPAWGGPNSTDGSWERLSGDVFGNCVDTDDNSADFVRNHGRSFLQNMGSPLTPCAAPPVAANVMISEFRPSGPLGAEDEFVEVFNPSGGVVDISGWTLTVPGSGVLHTFQGGTILGPGQYYVVGAGSTYLGFKDDSYTGPLVSPWLGTNDSIELKNGPVTVDAVAWGAVVAEGSSLPAYVGIGGDDISYTRSHGGCTDVNDNLWDFVLSFLAAPGTGAC